MIGILLLCTYGIDSFDEVLYSIRVQPDNTSNTYSIGPDLDEREVNPLASMDEFYPVSTHILASASPLLSLL
ncbi:hypothetical protein BDW59DRAFT_144323 [Aspergillus cavernicola]|uniref:Uncharacterized protein n=1 Tax=Aspergillus cavernicola TaxID=176166 RepID=A0ABR4IHB7_9EURO